MHDKHWFTSDHHFGHKDIIKYCQRPFESVEEMDRELIVAWNSVVRDDDTVYHLGDFTLADQDRALKYFEQLNGRIFVLNGTHDEEWFKKAEYHSKDGPVSFLNPLESLKFYDPNFDEGLVVVLCHYAMRVWDRSHYGSLHLYGHSHGELDGRGRSMDVGVDTHPQFRPYSLEEIKDELLKFPVQKRHRDELVTESDLRNDDE